jgi:biofilm PGA synthesis N-glycosyltransferase PgaC
MDLAARLVIVLGIVNLIRMALFMIGSDWQDIRRHRAARRTEGWYYPSVTVIVPAHNEETVILRAVESVYRSNYPRLDVIVVDDGSDDGTLDLVRRFQANHGQGRLRVLTQPNQGKAVALNHAIDQAYSDLVMVLDADSLLDVNAVSEIVNYFRDPAVGMVASNVKILRGRGILNLAQRFEYLVGHRLKRSLTAYNCEYVVGGVGSTFRRATAVEIGCYDTDTMTEDIDFTLKMIRYGDRSRRVMFAPHAISYTESVLTFRQLVQQRFRWKFGRLQAFLKNSHLFFSRRPAYDKRLTWMNLPFAVYSEGAFLLEPLVVGFVLYVTIRYQTLWTIVTAYGVMTLYVALNVLAEDSNSFRERLRLLWLAPVQYPLLLIVSAAEYCALILVLTKLPELFGQRRSDTRWQHVERAGGRRAR